MFWGAKARGVLEVKNRRKSISAFKVWAHKNPTHLISQVMEKPRLGLPTWALSAHWSLSAGKAFAKRQCEPSLLMLRLIFLIVPAEFKLDTYLLPLLYISTEMCLKIELLHASWAVPLSVSLIISVGALIYLSLNQGWKSSYFGNDLSISLSWFTIDPRTPDEEGEQWIEG